MLKEYIKYLCNVYSVLLNGGVEPPLKFDENDDYFSLFQNIDYLESMTDMYALLTKGGNHGGLLLREKFLNDLKEFIQKNCGIEATSQELDTVLKSVENGDIFDVNSKVVVNKYNTVAQSTVLDDTGDDVIIVEDDDDSTVSISPSEFLKSIQRKSKDESFFENGLDEDFDEDELVTVEDDDYDEESSILEDDDEEYGSDEESQDDEDEESYIEDDDPEGDIDDEESSIIEDDEEESYIEDDEESSILEDDEEESYLEDDEEESSIIEDDEEESYVEDDEDDRYIDDEEGSIIDDEEESYIEDDDDVDDRYIEDEEESFVEDDEEESYVEDDDEDDDRYIGDDEEESYVEDDEPEGEIDDDDEDDRFIRDDDEWDTDSAVSSSNNGFKIGNQESHRVTGSYTQSQIKEISDKSKLVIAPMSRMKKNTYKEKDMTDDIQSIVNFTANSVISLFSKLKKSKNR